MLEAPDPGWSLRVSWGWLGMTGDDWGWLGMAGGRLQSTVIDCKAM